VVPFNENRGVYWLRSADGGETWTKPALVFNAALASWQAVGRPALAIGKDDSLQIVFEQASLPGEWPVQGLFHTIGSRLANTISFSAPEIIAPAGSHNPQLAIAGNQLHLVYHGQVGLETRRLDLPGQATGWSAVEHLNGWQYGVTGAPAFGLSADTQNAHLVSPLPDGSGLRYSDWLTGTQADWTNPPEKVIFPPLVPNDQAPLDGRLLAVSVARMNGGWLAVAWVTQWEQGKQAFMALRSIPVTTVPAKLVLIPTNTPTPAPTLTAAPPAATSTPDLSLPVGGHSQPVNPIYIGGGLAGLMVLLALGGYSLFKTRKH
jgi:hypothetical protein